MAAPRRSAPRKHCCTRRRAAPSVQGDSSRTAPWCSSIAWKPASIARKNVLARRRAWSIDRSPSPWSGRPPIPTSRTRRRRRCERRDAVRVGRDRDECGARRDRPRARAWSLRALGDDRAVAGISSRSRPTRTASRRSASTSPTCSASGIGSAAAIPWTRLSAYRRCSPSAPNFPRDARRLPRDGRALPHRALRAESPRPHGAPRASGTAIFSTRRPSRCCHTINTSSGSRRTCSS